MPKTIIPKSVIWSCKHSLIPAELEAELASLMTEELSELAHRPLGDWIDIEIVAALIENTNTLGIKRQAFPQLIWTCWGALEKDLKKRQISTRQLLDDKTFHLINGLLDGFTFSRRDEKWLTHILDQPFIHELLVDVIHLSLVNFYKKINPIFGGLATQVLEKQIKGFIGMFIPMVRARMKEFILQKENRAFLLDFGRSLVRMILEEPISELLLTVSSQQKKKATQVAKALLASQKLESFGRELVTNVARDLFRILSKKSLADFIETGALEALCRELLRAAWPLFSRPRIARFISELSAHLTEPISQTP